MERILRPPSRLPGAVVAIVLIAALATGCASLDQRERELTFRVVKADAGWFSGLPPAVHDLYLPVNGAPDAPRINAWWWPDDDPQAPAILYLHGARWNLTGHLRRIDQLRRFGFSVLAIDYRGFGRSDGELPSEAMAYEDARAGWAWLATRQPDPARRFIYGHSLGGAVAIDLAAHIAAAGPHARGLVVESTFTSLADIAAEMTFSWLPTGLFLSQKFDSIDKIRTVALPVLVVHGAGDRFVPARFSEALYRAAREPKKLLLIENGSHNNSMWMGDAAYQQALGEIFGLRGTPEGDARVNGRSEASGSAL
jgi:hypothetical protein